MKRLKPIMIGLLGLSFIALFNPNFGYAQCSLTCNAPNLQVSLDNNCLAMVTPDDILEGNNNCLGPLSVQIFDPSGNIIPTNPFVDATYLDQTLAVRVVDGTTGNYCESSILIKDYINPVITCNNLNLPCTVSTHPDDIGYPGVTDNCDGNPTLSYTDNISNPNCDVTGVYIITRTWTAEDASGNFAIPCVQTITLERPNLNDIQFPLDRDDMAAPSLDCINPNITPDSTGYPKLNGFDLIDGTLCEVWVMYNDLGPFPICDASYSIIRTWTITDECSGSSVSETQEIKVMDTTEPMINCADDFTVSASSNSCNASFIIPNATTTDDCSNNSNISITIQNDDGVSITPGSIQNLPVGIYTYSYTATDDCGNSSDCSLQVTVDDGVNPVTICNSYTTVSLGSAGETLVPAFTFDDGSYDNCGPITYLARRMDNPNCPGNDASILNTNVPFYCCDVGDTVMVEMQIRDGINRLSNTCMVEVFVQEKLDPEIICPPDITLDCSLYELDPSVSGEPEVYDNCGVLNVSYTDEEDLNICNTGTVTRTWTVNDHYGQSAVCVQTITLVDTTDVIIVFPPDVEDAECGDADDFSITGEPIIEDDCGAFAVNNDDSVIEFEDGCLIKTIRVWTVYDWCNDTTYYDVQIIKEFDTQAPVFSGSPVDLTVECDAVPPLDVFTAMDECGNGEMVSSSEVISPGTCADEYTITRKWFTEDICGNTDSLIQIIMVIDSTPPTILGESPDTIIDCDVIIPEAFLTATDNCDPSVTLDMTENIIDGACSDEYMIVRTWTATDNCGNQTIRTQNISVQDTIGPMLSGIPMDLTVECDMVPDPPVLTASDNCDPNVELVFNESTTQGDCLDNYTITRSWTAMDNCGNQVTTSQTINVDDTSPPVLSGMPMDMTVECGNVPDAPTITAIDNCDQDVEIDFEETMVTGVCNEDVTVTRTWTATDNCGNTASASQVITSLDTEAPVLSEMPMDTTVECGNVPDAPMITATDNCDQDVEIEFEETAITGLCSEDVTVTRTWTATDNCGNTVSATQIITSSDTEAPVLVGVPVDMTVECGQVNEAPTVTVTDNCDQNILIDFTEVETPGDCDEDVTVTRTWTATDDCGNSTTETQVITSSDLVAPILIGVPVDVNVECGEIPDAPIVTATDNCLSNVIVAFDEEMTTGGCAEDIIITRTWTASDNCGNVTSASQTISSSDITAPVLNDVPVDMTVECGVIPDAPNVSATDNCDMDVMVVFGEVRDTGICIENLTVTRTWTATDNCGNTTTETQVITSSDTEAPILSATPVDMTVECGDIPDTPMITASDNCASPVLVDFSETIVNGSCAEDVTVTRTWSASDNCGNTVSVTQVITSADTEVPLLDDVPDDMLVQCDAIPDPPVLTASDNCDDDVTVVFEEIITEQNCTNEFVLTWKWTATDNCGNVTVDSTTLEVIDDTAPVLMGVPANITVECTMVPDAPMPTATDNCDDSPEVHFDEIMTGPTCGGETYQIFRTWTAIDDCQNQSIRTQIITLFDETPPVFTNTPDDITVECDSIPAPAMVMAEDACMNGEMFTVTEETIPGDCTHSYTLNRTWTVTDSCGNSDDFTQMITVEDNTPPTINCPNDVTFDIQSVGICGFTYPMSPNFTDNCDPSLDLDYEIDFGNDGVIDSVGTIPGFPFLIIEFPIGDNTVTFNVVDDCGNVASCSTMVQVNDLVPPAFFCNPQTIALDNVDSMAFVVPSAFLLNPFLECCLDSLSIEDLDNPGQVTDTLFLDYDDFILSQMIGGIPIEIFAVDCYGNTSSCVTKVFVLPPMSPPGFGFITGEIFTEEGDALGDIEVNLDGGMSDEAMTTEMGAYEFMDLPESYEYYIEPFHNEDPMNGVSTWDLILLQRHILALNLLDSPYKMIAGDINRSGTISTFDLVALRKLILGIDTYFQSNTSWRFVDANFVFPNEVDPFESSFPEFCTIANLESGVVDMSFVAVKTGDLNGSVETGLTGMTEDRNSTKFSFETEDQYFEKETLIHIPIRARDFEKVLGFQFSLQFDPGVLEFEKIESGSLPDLAIGNFGLNFIERGLMTCSWFSIDELSRNPESVLFELTFKAKTDGSLSDFLKINSEYTSAELYRTNKEIATLDLEFKTSPEANAAFELFQNRPNPFQEETLISFSLKESSIATISIFNASGKLIWKTKGTYPEGYNELVIRKDELESSGLYFYQLQTKNDLANKRMILVD